MSEVLLLEVKQEWMLRKCSGGLVRFRRFAEWILVVVSGHNSEGCAG